MLFLPAQVVDLSLEVGHSDRRGVVSPAPEMPSRVMEHEVVFGGKELPCGSSLEEVYRLYLVHPFRERSEHVDMLGQDREFHYTYPMAVRGVPHARRHQVAVGGFPHHPVAVLGAPFENPHVAANAVAASD